ncbi:MAG TPA: PilZ domain-containing protein, partial [Geobacteraceae bacterium]
QFLPVIERREPRVSCRMPVHVEAETGPFTGVAHDVAMNGIYVATDRHMDSADEIILNFRLPPGQDKAIVARGRIAWCKETGGGAEGRLPKGFGAEFLEITGEDGTIAGYNHLVAFLMRHKAF